jgi:hypothetical protein
VKIQTPPQSPEELPRRLSSGHISPPPPSRSPEDDDEESDSTATADSDLEQALRNTRRNSGSLAPPPVLAASTRSSGAPYNPFARTLATSEASFGLQRSAEPHGGGENGDGERPTRPNGTGRPAMDVDQFKNILMTGSPLPSPRPNAGIAGSVQYSNRLQDSSSNTDASSNSHQSLFDPYLDMNSETPRTSFDAMGSPSPSESSDGDNDEERSGLMSGSERLDDFAPPAPPKPGQTRSAASASRGPQSVSFANFDEEIADSSRTGTPQLGIDTGVHMKPPPTLHRSPSDLNKPLPPPPTQEATVPTTVAPAEVDVTPPTPQKDNVTVDPAEDDTESKRPAPPPPVSRRVGQGGGSSGRARSGSAGTQTSSHDDNNINPLSSTSATSKGAAPPPPPSRKAKPSATDTSTSTESSSQAPSPSPATVSSYTDAKAPAVPAPPPRRMASKAGNSVARSPSNASRTSAQRKEGSATSAPAPPAPPPRRAVGAKRESVEVQHATSEGIETPTDGQSNSRDVLADMMAFQQEIVSTFLNEYPA